MSFGEHHLRETIENWVGDFCQSDALTDAIPNPSKALQAHAPGLLTHLLVDACARADAGLDALDERALSAALLEHVARLDVPAEVHARVPRLAWAFLRDLERSGRLADGRAFGAQLKALGPAYAEAAAGKPKPIKNPGTKLRRNDPCPCGSGKKYKQCCQRG